MFLKRMLGQILKELGFITDNELDDAVRKQRQLLERQSLPERLQRDRLISEARLATYADAIPMIGQILVDMQYITELQLQTALAEQGRIEHLYGSLDAEKLGAAIEIGYLVNSTLNLAEVLGFIMRYVNRVTGSVASTLMLLDRGTGELVFSVPTGPKAEKLVDIRIPPGKGIAGWVAEHGQYVLVPDVTRDPRFYGEIDKISGFETKSVLCVPLKARLRLIGVLEVINKKDDTAFSEEDAILLGIFAHQAALAIENARMYNELRDQMNEILEGVAQRRKAEEELLKSERRFKDLFDNSPDAIFVEDFEGKVLDVNPAACRLHGATREELIGKDVYELIPPERRKRAEAEFPKLVNGECDILQSYSLTKDVRAVPVEIRASRIEYTGKPALLLMVRDVTERKKVEEELLRASKLESVGILAGGIAHDFNNLLTAILGNVSLLMLQLSKDQEGYGHLMEVEKAALRARDLTQQLLTFSKGGSPVKRPGSIVGLVQESAGFALSGSNVSPSFSMGNKVWAVEMDGGQISQMINNIVINADHAMPDGGTVEISCGNVKLGENEVCPLRTGRYVKVTVKDRGIGIREEHLSKIFDPYFTTKSKGFGLGLATAYSIVKNHGGLITVESEIGKGTSFHVYLPALDLPPSEDSDQPPRVVHGDGTVLVMDDEESVRMVCGDMLKSIGFEVDYASNGEEALNLYKKNDYAVVIMDLTIQGGMGGKQAMSLLMEHDPGAKVIVSSGYSNDPVMSEYQKYGFKGVIVKPYCIEDLIDTIGEVLNG
ncbi:MAG: PAS domain S-box protein [Spirochaetes bacterium]|nr:PAS domain S-box protein [Spirochaetota bacterium]